MSLSVLRHAKSVILCLVFICGLVSCQAEPEMITVGVISAAPVLEPVFNGFKEGMEEWGYIEGENIRYIYDGPAGALAQLPGIADSLVAANVDLILALSTPAAIATKDATATTETQIPVVFVPVTDPIDAELVVSLSEPGGNMTGVTNGGGEARRLQWLVDITGAQKIYMPYNADEQSAKAALQHVAAAALELDVELVTREVTGDEQMRIAARDIPEDVDAVFMLPDAQAIVLLEEFVASTIEHQLPFSSPSIDQVKAGALLSFGIDFFLAGKQAARLADQILDGTDPAVLPVESGEFFLYINLKTAEAINVDIDEAVLNQATIIRE